MLPKSRACEAHLYASLSIRRGQMERSPHIQGDLKKQSHQIILALELTSLVLMASCLQIFSRFNSMASEGSVSVNWADARSWDEKTIKRILLINIGPSGLHGARLYLYLPNRSILDGTELIEWAQTDNFEKSWMDRIFEIVGHHFS